MAMLVRTSPIGQANIANALPVVPARGCKVGRSWPSVGALMYHAPAPALTITMQPCGVVQDC